MATSRNGRNPLEFYDEKTFPVFPARATTETSVIWLSNIDLAVTFTLKIVLFYPPSAIVAETGINDIAERMIRALEEILVPYHFLAGRMRMNTQGTRPEIVCNRAGALIKLAYSSLQLCDLGDLTQPNPAYKYLVLHGSQNIYDDPLLMVQATIFKCRGLAIGVSYNHGVMGGREIFEFLMNLASVAKGNGLLFDPEPDRTMLKARSPPQIKYPHYERIKLSELAESPSLKTAFSRVVKNEDDFQETSTTTLFSYSSKMINRLRKIAMATGSLERCSPFDIVAAMLWKARTMAMDMPGHSLSKLFFAANIRSKMNPPLPIGFAGNGILNAYCIEEARKVREMALDECVKVVQEAKRRVADEYVRSAIDFTETYKSMPALLDSMFITSWLAYPIELADFGIGKPIFLTPVTDRPDRPLNVDFVYLLPDTQDEGGVHIYITLPHPQVARYREVLYGGIVGEGSTL